MQGQKSTVESFHETFEFDHGSSLSNSGMDQQIFWNNMLLNPVETQTLPDYLLSPSDTNMSYMNVASQDSGSLSIWNSGGPGSSQHSLNQGSHDETKMEHGWTSSLTINGGGGPRIEERQFEASNILSLDNVNINLNTSLVGEEQSFSQNSNPNDVPQNSDQSATQVGINIHVPEARLFPHPYNPALLESEHAPSSSGSSNPCGTSLGGVGFLSEDGNGGPGGSFDGRRLSCKRKNIEGVTGQTSASGSASLFHQSENSLLHSASARHNSSASINISSPSDYISVVNSPEEQLNSRFGTVTRGVASDCYPSLSVAGNAESSHRNYRMRINPAHQHDTSPPYLWPQGNPIRRPNVWSPHHPSPLPIPFNQSLESRPIVAGASSQSHPHVPIIPGLPRNVHPFPWNGVSNSRIGSSSSSPIILGDRLPSSREETSSTTVPRNNISEHPAFIPTTGIRHVVQDPTNWSLANGSISIPGNVASTSRAGPSSGVHPLQGPTWVPHQNPLAQYPRNLSEVVRRSLFPSGGPDSGGQSSNFLPQRSAQSSASQEIGHQSGAAFRGHQPPIMRSAFLMDRQSDGVLGAPLSLRLAAAREGRSRMISEIRNALDLMRRGENLRFEDVFILDQSVFYGAGDLHDRHRDMRLDVDNMSYEELLALEERIGNVSTGLGEETVLKCLKQRKYFSITMEASVEVEPCCICQEEYNDGEELGLLDCGHDFHSGCIKQWLTHKNLCPICKTTALVT